MTQKADRMMIYNGKTTKITIMAEKVEQKCTKILYVTLAVDTTLQATYYRVLNVKFF